MCFLLAKDVFEDLVNGLVRRLWDHIVNEEEAKDSEASQATVDCDLGRNADLSQKFEYL